MFGDTLGGVFMMFWDGFDAFWALQTPILSLIALREASRGLVACKGSVGDLAIFGRFGVKNDPKKKVPKCVWGYFGGVFMMFPDGFDAFWALETPFSVPFHLA